MSRRTSREASGQMNREMSRESRAGHPVPLAARILYTAWMLAWVPLILATAGAQNFWWLCNCALFIVLVATWFPSPLLISSQAGTVTVVGLVWAADLAAGLVFGDSPTGITAYMFEPALPLIQRLASLYHLWFPIYAVWLCRRQGYDDRGPWLQCVIGSLAIVGGWWFGDPVRNLNYTQAPFGIEQTWLPDAVYLPLLCVATAAALYWPGHRIVRWVLARTRSDTPDE